MTLILLPAGINNKFYTDFSLLLTLQKVVSVFSGMKEMKKIIFHAKTFDLGHSLVSDAWLTFLCLLFVGRDCVIHVHIAQIRECSMIIRN